MAHGRIKVFFDGGCRPNPGLMEAAVVVRGAAHLFSELGYGSSADAEWLALLGALELSQSLGLGNAELIGDALDVIRQANAALRSGQAASSHAAALLGLAAKGPPGRIRWIKREQNLAGIALAAQYRSGNRSGRIAAGLAAV